MAAIQNPHSRDLIISYRVQNLHKYLEIVCMDFNYSSSDFSKKHDLVILLTLIRCTVTITLMDIVCLEIMVHQKAMIDLIDEVQQQL